MVCRERPLWRSLAAPDTAERHRGRSLQTIFLESRNLIYRLSTAFAPGARQYESVSST